MKFRAFVLSLFLVGVGLTGPGVASSYADASQHASHVRTEHACTRTSSGKCIKGGEFCPQAKFGHSGYDAKGRRYVCKGSHSHPHWMKP
jgi:hypothetical protein